MNYTKEKFSNRLEWLKARQKGLGGSDIAVIFRKSTFQNDYVSLYLSKTEKINEEDVSEPTGYAKLGIDLEPSTLADYEKIKGVKLDKGHGGLNLYKSKKHPELIASLDGYDSENNVVVECKVVTHPAKKAMWKTEDDNYQIPEEYILQVAHYCNIMDAKKADVIVRFLPENKEVIISYERNQELESIIQKGALEFWHKYIKISCMPSINAETPYESAIKMINYHAEDYSEKTPASKDIMKQLDNIKYTQNEIKDLEKVVKKWKTQVLMYCQEHSCYDLYNESLDKKVASVIKFKGKKSFDSKALAKDDEELYNKYIKEGKGYNVLKIN